MKIILGFVAAAAIAAGAYTYTNSHRVSPDVQEVEEAEKLNPLGPAFNADSAFAYCDAQCQFGPRTMNSEAHERCGEWIVSKFRQFGCQVETQKADLKGYDGTVLKNTNIIAHTILRHPHASFCVPIGTVVHGQTMIPTVPTGASRSWLPTMAPAA